MARPINVGLSPNAQADDVALAEQLLLEPDNWIEGPNTADLELEFEKVAEVKSAIAFRSGRSALYASLMALTLERGDEVLMQAFTCVAVPNAAIWAGGKPVYVDIGNDLNMSPADLVKKLTPKSRVLIIQHTFGLPADIDSLMAIARERKLAVIEDCAHSLGAKYGGKPVGTFGDISIFSFGRDKVISSVFGGMAATGNPEIATTLLGIRNESARAKELWVKKQLKHPILMNKFILPNYSEFGKIFLEAIKRLGLISKAVYPSERHGERAEDVLGKMPNALALLALNQLKKLKKFNEHRRKIAAIYDKTFAALELPIELPRSPTKSESIYLRYAIQTDKAGEIIKRGRKNNILLDDWYNPVIAPPGVLNSKVFYDPRSCPNAERISKLVVNLPTNINTSEQDAEKVVELIKSAYGN